MYCNRKIKIYKKSGIRPPNLLIIFDKAAKTAPKLDTDGQILYNWNMTWKSVDL
jgi:hypothetical protein